MRSSRKKNRRKKGPSGGIRGGSRQYEQYEAEDTETNPHLKAIILEIVENQLSANDPPETRQTLERLLAAGHSRQAAVEMIGSAVVGEIWSVWHEGKPFDRERFKAALDGLG